LKEQRPIISIAIRGTHLPFPEKRVIISEICRGDMRSTTITFVSFLFALCASTLILASTIGRRSIQDVRIGDGTLSSLVIPPRPINSPAPEYTQEARQRHIEGNVTVQAEFDIFGKFRIIRIAKGLGFGLDESALMTLSSWRFTPAYKNGARVAVIADVDVPFKLDNDLYRRAIKEFERNGFQSGRLLLQQLINTYHNSDYLPTAKYQLAESFYNEGTPSSLKQAANEFKQFLTFFPSSTLSESAKQRLVRLQQRLGTIE